MLTQIKVTGITKLHFKIISTACCRYAEFWYMFVFFFYCLGWKVMTARSLTTFELCMAWWKMCLIKWNYYFVTSTSQTIIFYLFLATHNANSHLLPNIQVLCCGNYLLMNLLFILLLYLIALQSLASWHYLFGTLLSVWEVCIFFLISPFLPGYY